MTFPTPKTSRSIFAISITVQQKSTVRLKLIKQVLENKWYIDEIFHALIVSPIRKLSDFCWKVIDVAMIDRVVLGVGKATQWTGATLRVAQTGSVQIYAFMLLLGLVATTGYFIYGWN